MYDICGDIHGCNEELKILLGKLQFTKNSLGVWSHPENRIFISVGDIIDRGPNSVECLSIVMEMVKDKVALVTQSNHDDKLLRYLKGNKVTLSHGLEQTVKALDAMGEGFKQNVREFLESLPVELILDDDKLSVSHAGLTESLQGKTNGKARSQALYGMTTGKVDPITNFPIRLDWAKDYKGKRVVVHGHTPLLDARNLNNVWCVDTGCPFGNYLSCLRYPEMTVTQVKALAEYQPYKPFGGVTTDGDPG